MPVLYICIVGSVFYILINVCQFRFKDNAVAVENELNHGVRCRTDLGLIVNSWRLSPYKVNLLNNIKEYFRAIKCVIFERFCHFNDH